MAIDTSSPVEVDTYKDVLEVWRCPHMSTRTAGPGDAEVRGGTIVRIDGPAHLTRRRALGQLLSHGGHKYFRDTHLFPTGDAALAKALENLEADGYVHLEIRTWARRVLQQLAAALVGFDGATTPEGGDELFGYVEEFISGYQGILENAFNPVAPSGPVHDRAVQGRDAILEKFFAPSVARRVDLLTKVEAGELAAEELPRDLITLALQQADPAWADVELAKREAVFMLAAGVHTTSNALVWTLRELFDYFEKHPEQKSRIDDDEFLLGAASEALRLHPVVAGFVRRAEEDVELPSGDTVHEDSLVVIRSGPPGVDVDAYGEDAADFNPDRQVAKNVSRHGFAFGAGPHMCFGTPIVMGLNGIDGSLVYLLKLLVRAGVELDPASPPFDVSASRGSFDPFAKTTPLLVMLPAK